MVRLVMLGRANAEIADDLFLSKRTVESHLRNVFLKLGVSSRKNWAGSTVRPRPERRRRNRPVAGAARNCVWPHA